MSEKLAQVLEEKKASILSIWEALVRKKLPAARLETRLALRDSIPEFLDDLAIALRTSLSEIKPEIIRFAHKHGSERAHLSEYSLEDALTEYNILRKVIFKSLEETSPISQSERDIILEAIDFGMMKAGAEYAKLQVENLSIERTKLQAAIEQMPAAVWIADVSTGEIIKNTLGQNLNEAQDYIDRVINKGEKTHDEIKEIKRDNGTTRLIRMDATSIVNEDGLITNAVAIGTDLTERFRTEEELKVLFDSMATGKIVVDSETNHILRANAAFSSMLGYAHNEIIKMNLADLTPPEELEEVQKNWPIQKKITRKDGTFLWCEVYVSSLPATNEHPHRTICTVIDVNERKKVEDKAREVTAGLKLITDIQPSIIGQVDTNLRYLFVNKAYEEWFQTSREDIIGKSVRDIQDEESFQKTEAYFKRALQGEKVVFETEIKYKKGPIRFVHSTYNPGFDDNGKVTSIYISVTDLTEQRKILEDYKRSEAEFRNLANAIPQQAWMADRSGGIFWYNERWYDFTGIPQNSTPDLENNEAIHPDHKERIIKSYRDKILKADQWEEVFPMKNQLGQWSWFLSRAIPIKDKNGKVMKWFGTNTDITDQKKTSDELYEEQILRDKFISALSHDLRTPLTNASISTQLIQRKTQEPSTKILADKVNASLKRVDKMIEDLLDANSIRAGKNIVPELQEMNVVELVKSTIEELGSIYGDRFILDSPEVIMTNLSPNGIRRVIENLCTNAIKYGSQTAPVTISLHKDGVLFSIGVHNFGTPLKDTEKGELFGQFFRSSEAIKSGIKGWGIGLSIVKSVVESHGGKVDIESDDHGTLFNIILPIDASMYVDKHQENNSHDSAQKH